MFYFILGAVLAWVYFSIKGVFVYLEAAKDLEKLLKSTREEERKAVLADLGGSRLQERLEFLEAQHRTNLQEKIERAYNARTLVVDSPTLAQRATRADRR